MKIIKDPVHGYIEADDTVLPVLDSPELQRLRHITQLGFANLVYPGANHSRFEHSLGTMHLADAMCRQIDLDDDARRLITVSALLHDIGHGPLSHVIEPVMAEFAGRRHHEIDWLLAGDEMSDLLNHCDLDWREVSAVIGGSHHLSGIIHGDLDVDRMDYLMRDAHYTGVPYGTVDGPRLIRSTVLTDAGIALDESGISAAESLLIARTLMRPAVYFHHVSRIATRMFILAVTEDLTAGGRVGDATAMMRMDDAACIQHLLHSESGVARRLMERVHTRNLYKRALYVGETEVNTAALEAEVGLAKEKVIADEIADAAGVEPYEVLVDIPPHPSLMSMEIKVRNRHALIGLDEVSPVISTLNKTRRYQWRIGVYAPAERQSVVEAAATDILHVRKPTKQKRLSV